MKSIISILIFTLSLPLLAQEVKVDFKAKIESVKGNPWGKKHKELLGKEVTGFFIYDSRSKNVLTGAEVQTLRGGYAKRKEHHYFNHLDKPAFGIKFGKHTITGSDKPIIFIIYKDFDRFSVFRFMDGNYPFGKYHIKHSTPIMKVDDKFASELQLEFRIKDTEGKLTSAELPKKVFPLDMTGKTSNYIHLNNGTDWSLKLKLTK